MLTPWIQFGDYELLNIPTIAIGLAKPQVSPQIGYDIFSKVVLGNLAFTPVILTIDYPHSELVLRNSNYNIAVQPHLRDAQLIHFEQEGVAHVLVPGTLNGHKARFLLDTGSSAMVISPSFARKYLAFSHRPVRAATDIFGAPIASQTIHRLFGSLGNHPFTLETAYISPLATSADVLLGVPFFQHCRITVDHFRHLLLIEKE